jgi:hypothetical protein
MLGDGGGGSNKSERKFKFRRFIARAIPAYGGHLLAVEIRMVRGWQGLSINVL